MFEFHFIIEFILKDTKNHITLYSRSKQADNEFYRVRGYMSCNRVAVSYAGGGRPAGWIAAGRDN